MNNLLILLFGGVSGLQWEESSKIHVAENENNQLKENHYELKWTKDNNWSKETINSGALLSQWSQSSDFAFQGWTIFKAVA